jgi:hypothetical protein
MKNITALTLLILTSTNVFAKVECTKEPMDKWKSQKAFQEEMAKSYKIKKFKVTEGNCYEIYGWDKAGKKVEIYFNPVDGSIVKQRN